MKKTLVLILAVFFILPTIAAINLKVEKQSSNEVMILDLYEPAIFDLKITNFGDSDNFEFYNLLGFSMAPKGTVPIKSGATENVRLMIYPREDIKNKGFYTITYIIRGKDATEISQKITFKIIDLKDAFEVGSGEINPESNLMEVYIYNKEHFNFEEINAEFSSAFFTFNEKFSLGPNEKKTFEIELKKEDFKKLMAGYYTLNAEIQAQDQKVNAEGIIKFVEKDIITTTRKDYGFIISTKIIEKKNEGNTIAKSNTVIKKNIISRLFTSFSPEPDIVERDGTVIYYTWNREINPGESLEIRVKTNWLLPLLIIFFIIVIVVFAKQYSKTNLILRKQVRFVKAKGGEFALKVSIVVTAKKYVERVNIIDRLPPLVKVYERFGGESPSKIDDKAKKIEWNFEKLEAGETRILSYIIYSKLSVLGKFALPSAAALFERNGEIQEVQSNKAFFIAEQAKDEA